MRKIISIIILIFGFVFNSNAQENNSVPDTLIRNNDAVLYINVVSLKLDVIEYKKVNDTVNIFFISLSAIKELRMHNGKVLKGKSISPSLETVILKNEKEKDSIRGYNRARDTLKRNGHLLLTTKLSSIFSKNFLFYNNFYSLGLMYFPKSSLMYGFTYHKGFNQPNLANELEKAYVGQQQVLIEGYEFVFSNLTSKKNKIWDYGYTLGFSVSRYNVIQFWHYQSLYRYYNGIWDGKPSDSHVAKKFKEVNKVKFVPFFGFDLDIRIIKQLSLSTDVIIYIDKLDTDRRNYVDVEEYYDANNNLIDTKIEYNSGWGRYKEVRTIWPGFNLSLNYHFITKKK